jgi:importin-7
MINGCVIARQVFKLYAYHLKGRIAMTVEADRAAREGRVHDPAQVLDGIVTRVMAPLFAIAERALGGTDPLSGTMAHKTLKVWFSMIKNDMPPSTRTPESLRSWLGLCDAVLRKDIPDASLPASAEARESHPWWKAKKWAARAIVRFAEVYCFFGLENAQSRDPETKAKGLASPGYFVATTLLKRLWETCFGLLVLKVRHGRFLSLRVHNSVFHVFQALLSKPYDGLYKTDVKPHLMFILTECMMPQIMLSADEVESAVSDPDSFLHELYGSYAMSDDSTPRDKMREVLHTLFTSRINHVGKPFLSWATKTLAEQEAVPVASRDWRIKEAISAALSYEAEAILDSKDLRRAVEPLLVKFIAPDLTHPHPAMRGRALNTLASFISLQDIGRGFTDPRIVPAITNAALSSMDDASPVVKYQSGTALMHCCSVSVTHNLLRPHLRRILGMFFKLISDIEVSGSSDSLAYFISAFRRDFAMDTPAIIDMAMSLFVQLIKAADNDSTEHSGNSAYNLIDVILTLLSSTILTPRMGAVLQHKLLPFLRCIFRPGPSLEYFDEATNMVNQLIRIQRRVTPELWQVFPAIVNIGTTYCVDFVESLEPIVDTFISVDPAGVLRPIPGSGLGPGSPDRTPLEMIWHIVQVMNKKEASDQIYASYIVNTTLSFIPSHIDAFVTEIVKLYGHKIVASRSDGGSETGKAQTAFCATIGAALLHNWKLTTDTLIANGHLRGVLVAMTKPLEDGANYAHTQLSHKLIMLGLLRILKADPSTMAGELGSNLPAIMITAVQYVRERAEATEALDGDDEEDGEAASDSDDDEEPLDAEAMAHHHEFHSLMDSLGAAAAEDAPARKDRPVVIGEMALGEVVADDPSGWGDFGMDDEEDAAVPNDVDYANYSPNFISGDAPVSQIDSLLDYEAMLGEWMRPERAAAQAAMLSMLPAGTKESMGIISRLLAKHKSELKERSERLEASSRGAKGDPAFSMVTSNSQMHALAEAAAKAAHHLAAFAAAGVTAETVSLVDAAAAAASAAPAVSQSELEAIFPFDTKFEALLSSL